MNRHDIIIIGGGASGIYLSLLLKDYGHDVAIIESKDRILKKLLTTGNGRCNISNNSILAGNPAMYSSHNRDYTYPPLKKYGSDDAEAYFYSLGLPLITLEEGKMYPMSLQASSVVDVMRMSLQEKGVALYLDEKVKSIQHGSGFTVVTDTSSFSCDLLVIATGGASMPSTGSDGSMYKVIRNLGINVLAPVPALVQLKLDYPNIKALSGIKFDGFGTLYDGLEKVHTEFGEFLFTDYGISGPPILQLSRFAAPLIAEGRKLTLGLDMMPEMDSVQVKDMISERVAIFGSRSALDLLKGVINSKMISTLLKESGVDKPSSASLAIDYSCFSKLSSLLKDWRFSVTGTQGFNMAQGTYGGVDTKELTDFLESKKLPGLYFTGEVIDVIGACGGYNLQWAWSSAHSVLEGIEMEKKTKK
jgi:hypothetical protein